MSHKTPKTPKTPKTLRLHGGPFNLQDLNTTPNQQNTLHFTLGTPGTYIFTQGHYDRHGQWRRKPDPARGRDNPPST